MWFHKHIKQEIKWIFIISIITLAIVITGVLGAQTAPSLSWSRVHEPVLFNGDAIPTLIGKQIGEIFAFQYSGGIWKQIPIQVDEVDALGDYVVEDGILDANDELVFMAKDLGAPAEPTDWIQNGEAQNSIRYQLTITNPLNTGEVGYAYLYHSDTLTPTYPDYVSWDAISETIDAESYVLGLNSAEFFGIDSLELNGSGKDMFDRSKIRVNLTCIGIGDFNFNEVSLTSLMDLTMTPEIDGPVRVGGGNPESIFWAYPSIFEIQTEFDFGGISVPFCLLGINLNWLKFSFDMLDPVNSGMSPAIYYDSNLINGFAVDGVPDSVPSTPLNSWNQVSGADGSMVQVIDVSVGGGTIENYYKDDSTIDGGDTGDQQSFADAGIKIDNPTGTASIRFLEFILDPDQPRIGGTYRNYFENPLIISIQEQTIKSVYLPVVIR
jgi:hypothetical protein